ncbi:MAG: 4Fe-4S dicluster domain-containing protein [Acidobacteriaceae bacterium]
MPKDLSQTQWHGIARKEVPWFPAVNTEKCIGCELCFVTCGREVYDITPDKFHKAVVERPYNCMVGCSTCATVCPTQAISFPSRDLVWKAEREQKIFSVVHKEAAEKRSKQQIAQARERAEEQLRQVQTRARIEIAGEFGAKSFLTKLEATVKDQPCDIVNLRLEVPTVKGLLEKTPAYMVFEITSTEQQDVGGFLNEIRELVRQSGLIWIRETYV